MRLRLPSPTVRSALVVLPVVALLLALVPVAAPRAAADPPTAAETRLAELVNAARAENGLPPLQLSTGMTDLAQHWSGRMASGGLFVHNPDLQQQIEQTVTRQWRGWAENIAHDRSVEAAHAALLASPGHRRNILGDYTHLGTGVVVDASGRHWITETFLNTPADVPVVAAPEPTGVVDAVDVRGGGVLARGWAHVPGSSLPVLVRLLVDGQEAAREPASEPRPDVAGQTGDDGSHGYSLVARLAPGPHRVCVVVDAADGTSTELGCADVRATGRRVRLAG